VTEQQIQARRIKELEDEGYYVIKLMRTNKNGIPDLIAIPSNSDVLFVEVKTPKGKLSSLQRYRIKELNSIGIKTEIYNGTKKTDGSGDGIAELDSE
jgi:Holliday junction resolvase